MVSSLKQKVSRSPLLLAACDTVCSCATKAKNYWIGRACLVLGNNAVQLGAQPAKDNNPQQSGPEVIQDKRIRRALYAPSCAHQLSQDGKRINVDVKRVWLIYSQIPRSRIDFPFLHTLWQSTTRLVVGGSDQSSPGNISPKSFTDSLPNTIRPRNLECEVRCISRIGLPSRSELIRR